MRDWVVLAEAKTWGLPRLYWMDEPTGDDTGDTITADAITMRPASQT